jgi:hypothetical protein
MAVNGHSRYVGCWPIFPDNTDWVAQTQSSGVTIPELMVMSWGSATIPHRPTAILEETSTIYINIISDQPPHHSPDDRGRDDH